MMSRDDFYNQYDEMMPKFCEPYYDFLKIAASAVPKDAKSICDLGIGTGNLSFQIQKKIPKLRVLGIDLDEKAMNIAKSKINNLETYLGDIFSKDLPNVDYFVSSLTTHHFDNETRKNKLSQIVKSSKGFINLDLVLFPGNNMGDLLADISSYTKKHFNDAEVAEIEREVRLRDNPMPLEEKQLLFKELGLNFEILAEKRPYIVYRVLNK